MLTKPRLFAPKRCKLPKPRLSKRSKKDFELRVIGEADQRFHVVKQLRARVQQMMDDCQAETLAKEFLCARAVYLNSFLESQEVEALEGKKPDWRLYLQAVRALADVLSKLGLEPAVKTAKRLEDYIIDTAKRNGKTKVGNGKRHT
jgi:hypothetical protein